MKHEACRKKEIIKNRVIISKFKIQYKRSIKQRAGSLKVSKSTNS